MTTTTTQTNKPGQVQIPDRLFFRIGDVSDLLGIKPHVLRYWESEFSVIAPQKSASGQRVYRRSDLETLLMIKRLLHEERYSIEGARRRIRELRQEGELKSFKREILAESAEHPEPSGFTGLDQARSAAERLSTLAQRSLTEIFRY